MLSYMIEHHNNDTVKPPNKGPAIFVLYILFQRSKNVLVLWENEHLGPGKVSFIGQFFLLCPLFGGSFIGGSTVATYIMTVVIIQASQQHRTHYQDLTGKVQQVPEFTVKRVASAPPTRSVSLIVELLG